MKKLAGLLAALMLVAGCSVDPQAAAERRASLMEQVFPNPADRQGLYLVFPMESGGTIGGMLVRYYVGDVSEAEVLRRVGQFCGSQGSARYTGRAYVDQDNGGVDLVAADGSSRAGRSLFVKCERSA